MAKSIGKNKVRKALNCYKLAVELGPGHPWEQSSLDRAAKAMVTVALHRSKAFSYTRYVGHQPYYGALGGNFDPLAMNRFSNLSGLTRNAAKCLKCNTVIESKYRHDFVTCPCGNISVDGGLEYQRRVGTLEDYEELSEYKSKEDQT